MPTWAIAEKLGIAEMISIDGDKKTVYLGNAPNQVKASTKITSEVLALLTADEIAAL